MKFFLIVLFFFAVNNTKGQTCAVSVGDPIVNITFGQGSNFGSPLPENSISNITYSASTCPGEGFYAIVNNTSGCWPTDAVWHTASDHTGNDGYFMLINASLAPSNFYIDTINGLCSGITYQFAAWMLNMCSVTSTNPNVTFAIEKTDGTVLATYTTGDIAISNPLTWQQYSLNFRPPSGVSSVVLRMLNNAPGGLGNDLGLDDITFRTIGPSVLIGSTSLTGDTTTLCADDAKNVELGSSVESCYSALAYRWQVSTDLGLNWTDIPGATSTTYTLAPKSTGTYLYRLAVAQTDNISIASCRVASKPVIIKIIASDSRSVRISTPNDAICNVEPVTFTASITDGGISPLYQWLLNDLSVGSNEAIYTNSELKNGDHVKCILTSSLSCSSTPAVSNTISMKVGVGKDTAITHKICEGASEEGRSESGIYTDFFKTITGCDSTRMLNLTVYPKAYSAFDTAICYGSSYMGINEEGSFSQVYKTVHGCDSTHIITVHILPLINDNQLTDTTMCTGDSILLFPGAYNTYLWQDGSTQSSFVAKKGGTYSVIVTNSCATATKTMMIHESNCSVAFPTGFSPNNDGRNDVFKMLNTYHVTDYHLMIYNRLGQKVFESSSPQSGWDGRINGRPADIGSYVWFCSYAKESINNRITQKGVITLLR